MNDMKIFNQFDGGCETAGWPVGASAIGNAALTDAVTNKNAATISARGQTEPN